MKATEQHFPVVIFNMLWNAVLTCDSVDEILKCDKWKLLNSQNASFFFRLLGRIAVINEELKSYLDIHLWVRRIVTHVYWLHGLKIEKKTDILSWRV